jgi:carbon monoxide dehydrogenase subunit G
LGPPRTVHPPPGGARHERFRRTSKTKINYSVESSLTGKPGSIGQPVLRSKAKAMERQFAERLRAAFAAGQ